MVRSVSLPRLLSLLPRDGVGASVYPSRWAGKGLPVPTSAASLDGSCRFDVKKVRLAVGEDGQVRGRAWGVAYWKGKRTTPADKEYEPVPGGLKYLWRAAETPAALLEK
ncbi:hypothetical protein JCM10213_003722 [Rhodosporidiobolus nylandii]